MKNIKLFLLSLFVIITFGDIFSQGIELPDFVITGVQSVNIPALPKKRAELVSTLSKEFIKPIYSPEEFEISEPSAPLKAEAEIYKELIPLNGSLSVAAGINTQPVGEAYFFNDFDKINLFSKIYGNYTRAYNDNADLSITGAEFISRYFLDNKSYFLPGLKVQIGAAFAREWYKKFRSINPIFLYKIQKGSANLLVENTYLKEFNFGVELAGQGLFTNSSDFREMNYVGKGYFKLKLNDFNLNYDGSYLRQNISKAGIINYHFDYWTSKGGVTYSPAKSLTFGAGLVVASYDTNSFFSPTAFVEARVSKALSFVFEFAPNTEYFTKDDFYKENRYLNFNENDNIYIENKMKLNLAIKYEFQKLVEATIGFNIKSNADYYYFSDLKNVGDFNVIGIDDCRMVELYTNYFFKLGDYGELFGDFVYRDYRTSNGYVIPYSPAISLNFSYSYNINSQIKVSALVSYNHQTYSDIINQQILPDFVNLSLKGEYVLFDNFSINLYLENITNNKNYKFNNYLAKPLDIYAGINYKW